MQEHNPEAVVRSPLSAMGPALGRRRAAGLELVQPVARLDQEIAPSSPPENGDKALAAHRAYREAVHARQEIERECAGGIAAASDVAWAVVRALKAENAALAVYNRVLENSRSTSLSEVSGTARYDKLLTPREHEVLKLVTEGRTSKEIAHVLGISVKTACCHRYRIMDKLDVHSSAALTRTAIRLGFVNP